MTPNNTTPNALHYGRDAMTGFLRRGLFFNTPEAGDAAGTGGEPSADAGEGGTVVDTAASDSAATGTGEGGSQGAPDSGAGTGAYTDEQAYRLGEILEAIEKNPHRELNDEELELYIASTEGKLQPKKRGEGSAEGEEGQPPESGEDPAQATPAPEVEAAMKEVGAKSLAELPEKIKELRRLATGRDAQAYAQLKARHDELDSFIKGEQQLYRDAAAGKAEAIEFLRKERGLQVTAVQPGATGTDVKKMPTAAAPVPDEPPFSPGDDEMVGGALSKTWGLLKAQEERFSALETELRATKEKLEAADKTRAQAQAEERAKGQMVDEMHEVAQFVDELKALPDLKNRLADFLQHGKDDSQISAFFLPLFEATDKGRLTLKEAYQLQQAKNAPVLIAKAREEGVRNALGKPQPKTLSGMQTKSDARPATESVTEKALQAFESGEDLNALPKSWFGPDGEWNAAAIPEKYHDRLGIVK